MPRPGPRPYECVRRAWHSHRHQPMRGLIIRQIFRLVHENHSSTTKKNKEWQEKLPVVVLKAEEIMYSKANSEAEYTDLETLWDRVNDAIDTIIRKDESTETGELLPPCVEAALNLGCVAVRASRSQMHSNPRTYLKPTIQDSRDVSPKVLDENTSEQPSNVWPLHAPNIKKLPSAESPWTSQSKLLPENVVLESSGCVTSNIPLDDSKTPLNVGSVYPLYYGTVFQPQVSKCSLQEPQKPNHVIVGVPIYSSAPEPVEIGRFQNLLVSSGSFQENSRVESQTECDLSLRLGLFPESSSSTGKSNEYGTNCFERVSHNPRDKEFLFFPLEGEGKNVEDVGKKRKISLIADMDKEQFFFSQDPTCNHFAGRMKRPGM